MKTTEIAAFLVAVVVALAGFGSYEYTQYSTEASVVTNLANQVSSLNGQITHLQNLTRIRDSVNVVWWVPSCTFAQTCNYQVKVVNNNKIDLTVKQVTVNVLDDKGNPALSNTQSFSILVRAGGSVTLMVPISYVTNWGGASIQTILDTPYGQITVGTI